MSESLLAAALRCQSEGVLILEQTGTEKGFRIVFANDRFCKMTGYSPSALLKHRHGFLHTDPSELQCMRSWAATKSTSSYTGEGDLLGQDGHAIYAAWSFSRIAGKEECEGHLVAIYRDMTEKHRLQEALMLSQKLDAVGRMAGGVAHDFNNLVSVINGYSQLLASRLAGRPDELHELDEIQKAGAKAAGLTRQLLALGRRQPFSLCLLDLNQFIRESSEVLSRMLGATGTLELQLADKPMTVKADPDSMQQLLLNLILNSRDALRDKGKVTLSTSTRELSSKLESEGSIPAGRYAVLTVSDNGMGMDAHTLSHIFEPFFTTKPPDKGSGLGLAMVYGIVQQSGGYIRVSSTLLLGTTFEVILPLRDEPSSPIVQSFASSHAPSSRGHETILLVESDIIVAKMLSGMLANQGYRVLEASSNREAERVVKKEKAAIHLLIASIGPDAESRNFLARTLSRNPGLRVVCTAACGKDCHVAKICGTCQLCMPKPFAISEMLKAVRRLLDVDQAKA